MEPIYGNYLGIVINNEDPEERKRVQVFIPHLSNTLFSDWNNRLEDFAIRSPLDLGDKIVTKLKQLLPWAEAAAPIFGGSTGMTANTMSRRLGVNNDGYTFIESLPTGTGGLNPPDPLAPFPGSENGEIVEPDLPQEDENETLPPIEGGLGDENTPTTAPPEELPMFEDYDGGDVTGAMTAQSDGNSPSYTEILSKNGFWSNGNRITYYTDGDPSLAYLSSTHQSGNASIISPNGSAIGTINAGYAGIVVPLGGPYKPGDIFNITLVDKTTGQSYQVKNVAAIEYGPRGAMREISYGLVEKFKNAGVNWTAGRNLLTNSDNYKIKYEPLGIGLASRSDVEAYKLNSKNIQIENLGIVDGYKGEANENDLYSESGYKEQDGDRFIDPQLDARNENIGFTPNALTSASGSPNGTLSVPNAGAKVWVFFYGGDIQKPVYFASAIEPTT
jgi:hypothetical protein